MAILKSTAVGITRAKVVLLGAPAVGKTSLVARYVHSVFSEHHKSTLGVKVDRRTVTLDEQTVAMLIWDMHGEAEGLDLPANYLSGAAAAIVVADSSRPETVDVARSLGERFLRSSPSAQVLFVANKADLEIDQAALDEKFAGLEAHLTSAKSGAGVEELFLKIARSVN